MSKSKCPDCNSVRVNLFEEQGDGKCDNCHGDGLGDLMDQFATAVTPHGGKSQCSKCNGTGQCQTCGGTGFVYYEHSTEGTSNSSFRNTDSPKQESSYSSSSGSSAESSDGSGFAQVIGWLIGVVIIIWVVVWLAANIVLPIILLNSALALTILAVFIKQRKALFATFALIGGCYMILDVVNGWFSANFVNNVVKNPQWITGFVYLNAAAVGLSTWLLIEPQWAKAKAAEPRSKQRDNLWLGAVFAIVALAGASLPLVYHNVSNPFSRRTQLTTAQVNIVNDNNNPSPTPTVSNQIQTKGIDLAESNLTDFDQFYLTFKQAVLTKEMTKLADFVKFPFDYQGSMINRDDFIKNNALIEDIFKLVTTGSPQRHKGLPSYGINSSTGAIYFNKQSKGYWKLTQIYYGD